MGLIFERTDEYEAKLLADELIDTVYRDVIVEIVRERWNSSKLKAYCSKTDTYIQFPRALRTSSNDRYICDVVEVNSSNRRTFYRAVKNSIRNEGSLKVLA